MLILIFVFALFRLLQGAPLGATATLNGPNCDQADIFPRDTFTGSHLGTRALNDIIVSCFATIFACTWTAIHPNIPAPNDCGWDLFKRQVTTMVYALLAPEAITAWAMRQYFAARFIERWYNKDMEKISRLHKDKSESPPRTLLDAFKTRLHEWFHKQPLSPAFKQDEVRPWTITHGFFVQMGGFMLCEDGKPVQISETYNPNQLISLVEQIKAGLIDAPRTTEAEIQDRSKGDFLSKAIVVTQTSWFVAQCIVRWSAGLPVTELEIVTLGFATLNALTYALWWNKPQSVGVPVYLERKKLKVEVEIQTDGSGEDTTGTKVSDVESIVNEPRKEIRKPRRIPKPPGPGNDIRHVKGSFLKQAIKWELDKNPGWKLTWRIPYRVIESALRPISSIMDFSRSNIWEGDLRVPMFYSAAAQNATMDIALSVIASLFGLIHFLPAWFLDFPSRPEMFLWRISASIITAQPIFLGLWTKTKEGAIEVSDARRLPFAFLGLFGLPLYIISRISLIILAFLSLRHLPNNALIAINWMSFIPHL